MCLINWYFDDDAHCSCSDELIPGDQGSDIGALEFLGIGILLRFWIFQVLFIRFRMTFRTPISILPGPGEEGEVRMRPSVSNEMDKRCACNRVVNMGMEMVAHVVMRFIRTLIKVRIHFL